MYFCRPLKYRELSVLSLLQDSLEGDGFVPYVPKSSVEEFGRGMVGFWNSITTEADRK